MVENSELISENQSLKKQVEFFKKQAETEHNRFDELRRKYHREIDFYDYKIKVYELIHPDLPREFDLYRLSHPSD